MGELFEGFCVKLRKDLAKDVAQAIGELHSAVLGQRDLEQFAADIKAEVKTESAVLRQKLIQSVHQLVGEMRSSRPPPSSQEVAEPAMDVGALGSGLAELRAAFQAIGPEMANLGHGLAEVRRALSELQVTTACSSSSRPSPSAKEVAAEVDLAPLVEEVRGLRTHLDNGLATALQGPRSPVPRWAAADAAAGSDAAGGACRHHWPGDFPQDSPCSPAALSTSSTTVGRTGRDPNVAVLLEELRDFRSQHDVDIGEVVKVSKEVRATVLRELKDLQTQQERDLGNVVSAVKGTGRNCSVDLSPVIAEIRQLHPALHADITMALQSIQVEQSHLLRAVDEAKRQVDFTEVLQALRAQRSEVDLSPLLRAIDDNRHAADLLSSIRDVRRIVGELKEGKLELDLSTMVKELKQLQVCIDTSTSAVLQALRDGSTVVNLSGVLSSIHESAQQAGPREGDLAPVLRELSKLSSQVDASVAGILTTLGQGHVSIDISPMMKAIESVQTEVKEIKSQHSNVLAVASLRKTQECGDTSVGLDPVLKATESVKREVMGLSQRVEAIKQDLHEADVSEVLEAVNSLKGQFDLSQILRAIQEHRPQVDHSLVLRAISDSKSTWDWSRSVEEIKRELHEVKEGPSALELSPVMKALEDTKKQVTLAANGVLSGTAEIRQVVAELRDSDLGINLSLLHAEVQQMESRLEAGMSAVIKNVDAEKLASENSVDAMVRAIDTTRAEVINAVRGHRVDIDFAPVLQAISGTHGAADLAHHLEGILQALSDIRRGSLCADLPPMIDDVRQMLHRVEQNLSVTQSPNISAESVPHPDPEDAAKPEAPRCYLPQWQACVAHGEGGGWLAGNGTLCRVQDAQRRPASAPPRSTMSWPVEVERRHDDPDEDPDLALAESLAVRAEYLADAAAEAQCRAEAIQAAEAAFDLPMEVSVQSTGTDGWLPPIPEEPDREVSQYYAPRLDGSDVGRR